MANENSTEELDIDALVTILIDQCNAESICDDDLVQIFLEEETPGSKPDVEDEIKVIEDNDSDREGTTEVEDDPDRTVIIDIEEWEEGIQVDPEDPRRPRPPAPEQPDPPIVVQPPPPGPPPSPDICTDVAVFTDKLRGTLGAYYAKARNSEKFVMMNSYADVVEDSPILFKRIYSINRIGLDYTRDQLSFGFLEERYELTFKESIFSDGTGKIPTNLITSYLLGGLYRGPIESCGQEVDIVYTPLIRVDDPYQDDSFGYPKPTMSVAKSGYNFYIKSYENLQKTNISEYELPNLYTIMANNLYGDPSPTVRRINQFGGTEQGYVISSLSLRMKTSQEKSVEKDDYYGEFFDEFSKIYPSLSQDFKVQALEKQKNIFVAPSEMKRLMTVNDRKSSFPMFIELAFSSVPTRQFSSILRSTKLFDKFAARLADKVVKGQVQEKIHQTLDKKTVEDEILQTSRVEVESRKQSFKYIDFNEVMAEIYDENINNIDLKMFLPLGDYKKFENNRKTDQKHFIDTLYFSVFKNKVVNFLKRNFRDFNSILDGTGCYTETVMYRVAKYRGENVQGEPIQNIFIPNDPELPEIKYIDTQVKYDQDYSYVVYAYQVVVLNSYSYTNVRENRRSKLIRNLTVRNEPLLRIVEVPYMIKKARIQDAPPAPPEFSIHAYKDIDSSLLLMFNSAANTFMQEPTIITSEDQETFKRISESQGVPLGQKIKFSTDDRVAEFEIFRTLQRPTSYLDFRNSLMTKVTTDVSLQTIQEASSAAFVDSILPNTKYYYMFRSVDVHGKPSNPTEIIEVEMINEHGTIYPIIKYIDLAPVIKKNFSKPIRRFIKLAPSINNTILNEDLEAYNAASTAKTAVEAAKLGITDKSIWGKKIKVRLVSKQTKKVIDFGIKFDYDRQFEK